jgi:hypothetical protein
MYQLQEVPICSVAMYWHPDASSVVVVLVWSVLAVLHLLLAKALFLYELHQAPGLQQSTSDAHTVHVHEPMVFYY